MKIITKSYLLVGILVGVAIFNLALLYQGEIEDNKQSTAVIKTGDIKVAAESISALAISVANGNEEDKQKLEREIQNTEKRIEILRVGGTLKGLEVDPIPNSMKNAHSNMADAWNDFKESALKVETTPVFDSDATSSVNYLLQKNNDLVLLSNELIRDFETLDRDFNRHKEIANELAEYSKEIGQMILLISIGEGESVQKELEVKKTQYEIGLRKLLNVPTQGIDVEMYGMTHEDLEPIPRVNSETLRKIDPLWESMRIRINTLEERALLSPEFNTAKDELESKKIELGLKIDNVLELWNRELVKQGSEGQIIFQVLLGVNIVVFIIVLFIIRESISPLDSINRGLSKIKEGVYGEELKVKSTDEIGELANTFNIMSKTIKEKEEEARKNDIAKDEFLAMVTHELKTPLVPIQGYADILLSEHLGKLTEKQKERINIIKSSSETLLSIISDLLDAQKLELGQLKMKKEHVNIKDTILKTVENLKPFAAESNTEIITNVFDTTVNHDPERIKQVLSNLIKNSINAIQNKKGIIQINLEDIGDKIRIKVKDNGVGIPIEKQKDLFKKFYQVDASLTREKGGSGLGLAICKGIVENHGGEISVKTNINEGAEFSFSLPKDYDVKGSPI
ncbi:HAMP domain-containing histidine kinase [Nitrosopumilus sp. K4]|uniref:sensor histidine kinase n=1 Tax=Nitrosopumilus sp. K4 TaxID=2795383 RepID=UPI001BAD4521|nr:HAMP domain-containing sensor histidine kinase [Nitrosopumilus sp. K4]QUC65144.1 HAMP domain-containing histidine kinase [Nitrosopumilus sp. K4]